MVQRGRIAQGWGKRVKVQDDSRSALVHEIVGQLNEASAIVPRKISGIINTATGRVMLFVGAYDTLIRNVRVANSGAAMDQATTVMRLAYVDNGNWDESSPVTPTTKFLGTGFNGAEFEAGKSLNLTEFAGGINVATLNTPFKPFILPANKILYFELVNNEGETRDLDVHLEWANVDRIDLQPRDLQMAVALAPRNFDRRPRLPE